MKTIIFLIVMLFIFSIMQAQDKQINFIMQDGTSKQIPINEIDTMRFDDVDSSAILTFYMKSNAIKNYIAPRILRIKFDGSSKNSLIIDFIKLNYSSNSDTIKVQEIDSIVLSYQFTHVSIDFQNIYRIVKRISYSTQLGTNPKRDTSINYDYITSEMSLSNKSRYSDRDFYGNPCSECVNQVPANAIVFCSDYNSQSQSGSSHFSSCAYTKSVFYVDTIKHLIDSLEFKYYGSSGSSYGSSTSMTSSSTVEKLRILSIPYTTDSSGNIIAIIPYTDLKNKVNYYYYSNDHGNSSSYSSYYNTEDLIDIEAIDSTAKIEIKIYK